jgi:uncharacterized lipoprotein YbaY
MPVSSARTVWVSVVVAQRLEAGGGTAHVVVEDTSRADAPAIVVSEAVEPLAQPLAAGDQFTLELTVPDVDERASYNVRAHIDCSGSGEVSVGDRITTRSYPVLTHGAGDCVEVEVVQI